MLEEEDFKDGLKAEDGFHTSNQRSRKEDLEANDAESN